MRSPFPLARRPPPSSHSAFVKLTRSHPSHSTLGYGAFFDRHPERLITSVGLQKLDVRPLSLSLFVARSLKR